MSGQLALAAAVAKLGRAQTLNADDIEAFMSLPYRVKNYDVGAYLVREADRVDHCCVLLEGVAIRHRVTNSGVRQILSVLVAGDFIDLQNVLFDVADDSVQAAMKVRVALIPISAIKVLIAVRPTLAMAFWRDTQIDAAILREWIVNVGRRDAVSRVAHLLCELAVRLTAANLAENYRYRMPMTQEQIGDAVGLTTIHVNRTLRELERKGLVERDKRIIQIVDWEALREIGDFNLRHRFYDLIAAGEA